MASEHEDGEIEIAADENGLIVRVYNQGGYDWAEASVHEILSALTDEQRVSLFSEFCGGCGTPNLPCHCRNDE
jgi:hypothetical protein